MTPALVRARKQDKEETGDCDLVARLLCPTVGRRRADEIAVALLDKVDLLHIAKEDAVFFRCLGLEPAAVDMLTAALDLSARLAEVRITDRPLFETPEEVAQYVVQRYRLRDQEVFGALFLDHGGRLIASCWPTPVSRSPVVTYGPSRFFAESVACWLTKWRDAP